MGKILVSGLVNTETTLRVRQFPLEYYPIDYPFFGIQTAVSGVAYNIALALKTLGDDVRLLSMFGEDFQGAYIRQQLAQCGIPTDRLKASLGETPSSVVLYDGTGRRQIHCDLKDIQETGYGFESADLADADIVVACNINFNRELLRLAKEMGKSIATDVHVLADPRDGYNRDFMESADILFLSDEAAGDDPHRLIWELDALYQTPVTVMGRGAKGALMHLHGEDHIHEMPACRIGQVVNTVGAGDALFSAFLHFYGQGMEPVACLRRAQCFAAAKIRVSGASRGFISGEELEDLMKWN